MIPNICQAFCLFISISIITGYQPVFKILNRYSSIVPIIDFRTGYEKDYVDQLYGDYDDDYDDGYGGDSDYVDDYDDNDINDDDDGNEDH